MAKNSARLNLILSLNEFIERAKNYRTDRRDASDRRDWIREVSPLLDLFRTNDWERCKDANHLANILGIRENIKIDQTWITELAHLNRNRNRRFRKLAKLAGTIGPLAEQYGLDAKPFSALEVEPRLISDSELFHLAETARRHARSIIKQLDLSPVDSDPPLDKVEIRILNSLSHTYELVSLKTLAGLARCDRGTCATRIERLGKFGYVQRASRKSGVAITTAGRARLQRISSLPK
jgi:DNA-binding MarR family transcriptional regulator